MKENKLYDWANCQSQNKKKQKNKSNLSQIKVVQCNINAVIKLQCIYNDAIRTLFAQCTQPKYRNLSTNYMRRYWSWILLWQYHLSLPDIGMYFLWIQTENLVWNWYGSMEDCLLFHSWNLPLHSILASSIFHTKISIPYHALPASTFPWSQCYQKRKLCFAVHRDSRGKVQWLPPFYTRLCEGAFSCWKKRKKKNC